MHSQATPMAMFHAHRTANTLEALQNLLYLIRLDSSHPDRVNGYVAQAEVVVAKHYQIGPQYPS
jgi:hypothetical protein